MRPEYTRGGMQLLEDYIIYTITVSLMKK